MALPRPPFAPVTTTVPFELMAAIFENQQLLQTREQLNKRRLSGEDKGGQLAKANGIDTRTKLSENEVNITQQGTDVGWELTGDRWPNGNNHFFF